MITLLTFTNVYGFLILPWSVGDSFYESFSPVNLNRIDSYQIEFVNEVTRFMFF